MREKEWDLPIIVLTGLQDSSVGVQAVREGAQDYLVKGEVAAAALGRSVLYAIERHRQQQARVQAALSKKEARVIAFIGAKGGVGTTTLAHNAAAALGRDRQTVLLELSSAPETLSWYTCTQPSGDLGDLLEMTPERVSTEDVEARICKLPMGLQVLFSPQKAAAAAHVGAEHATAILRRTRELADVVVLDLPRFPSLGTQTAVRNASFVVLVTSLDGVGIDAARTTLGLLNSWGLSSALVGLAIVNKGLSTAPLKLSEVNVQTGCQVVALIPPVPADYASERNSGVPVVLGRPDCHAANAMSNLASRLSADPVRPVAF